MPSKSGVATFGVFYRIRDITTTEMAAADVEVEASSENAGNAG